MSFSHSLHSYRINILPGKVSVIRWYFFLNEAIGLYVLTIFCVDMSVCGALIFRNSHEVYSRVGDMSRTFKHLFVVINMPTQISHTCFQAGKIFLVKEEQGIHFPPRRYR